MLRLITYPLFLAFLYSLLGSLCGTMLLLSFLISLSSLLYLPLLHQHLLLLTSLTFCPEVIPLTCQPILSLLFCLLVEEVSQLPLFDRPFVAAAHLIMVTNVYPIIVVIISTKPTTPADLLTLSNLTHIGLHLFWFTNKIYSVTHIITSFGHYRTCYRCSGHIFGIVICNLWILSRCELKNSSGTHPFQDKIH